MVTINTGQSFNSTIGTLTYFPVSFSGNVSNWSAVGLPNGLKIDPASGYIFGVPQEGSSPFIANNLPPSGHTSFRCTPISFIHLNNTL